MFVFQYKLNSIILKNVYQQCELIQQEQYFCSYVRLVRNQLQNNRNDLKLCLIRDILYASIFLLLFVIIRFLFYIKFINNGFSNFYSNSEDIFFVCYIVIATLVTCIK